MREKEGILKKVTAITPLAVIIALVIVLGVNSVNVVVGAPEINISEIKITEPSDGFETNESSLCIRGIVNGTIDNISIENATLIHNASNYYNKSNITISEGRFESKVNLVEGINTFKVMIETNESSSVNVTFSPPSRFAAILTFMPWIIIGVIVFISFLMFFGIVERAEKQIWHYIFIIWIAVAIILPIGLFFVLSLIPFEKFEFVRNHVIVTIVASISLPLLVRIVPSIVQYFIKKGEKKRKEPSWEEETSYSIKFKVFDEKSKHSISDAKVLVTKSGDLFRKGSTNQAGIYECDLKPGKYAYEIEAYGAYKPKSGSLLVERSGDVPVPLSKRAGNLTVQVKDLETGTPVQGVNVSVSGEEKTTAEQGKASFTDVPIGVKEIKVEETKDVYSSETKICEIREGTTTEVSISIKSLLRIPIDKESKLNVLRNQLQDNYRRVSTYDTCIPFYYKGIVDNMVNLVKGMVDKPMLFVGSKNNPGETVGHLVDVIDLASHEVIGVMTSKRNVDVYSAAMRLENAEVEAKPVNFDDSRVLDYIRDAEAFYNSYYHTVQSKLFEMDTTITRKTGEMNILPVSGLWRVARTLLNETSASTTETDIMKKGAMTLVADILLDYTDDMLKDAKIIERLKIMVI
jgi:hypothetical protein